MPLSGGRATTHKPPGGENVRFVPAVSTICTLKAQKHCSCGLKAAATATAAGMRVAVLGIAGMVMLAHAAGTSRSPPPCCTLPARDRSPGLLRAMGGVLHSPAPRHALHASVRAASTARQKRSWDHEPAVRRCPLQQSLARVCAVAGSGLVFESASQLSLVLCQEMSRRVRARLRALVCGSWG